MYAAKTIKESIINALEEMGYEEKRIIKLLNEYENKTLRETGIFNEYICENLYKKNIIYIKNLINLTTKEAVEISNLCTNTIRYYTKKIVNQIKKLDSKIQIQEKVNLNIKRINEALIKLITKIKSDRKQLLTLKEEIIQHRFKKSEEKHWKYSRLNLTEKEISILIDYLGESINIENIYNDPKNYEIGTLLINIYNNLIYYFKKVKYKEILNDNYYEMDSIDLNIWDIRQFNRLNINCISDLIEYSEKEIEQMLKGNQKKTKRVLKSLKERNIITLEKKNELTINLSLENAGIIPNQKTKKITF